MSELEPTRKRPEAERSKEVVNYSLTQDTFVQAGGLGVMLIANVRGEDFIVPFCTTRPDLGDRAEEFRVVKQAVIAILDGKEIFGRERERELANLKFRIEIVAFATLKNFAHGTFA